MTSTSPFTQISRDAQIGEGCEIGHGTIIEGGVTLGKGCKIAPYCIIREGSRIGSNVTIDSFSTIGGDPQVTGWEKRESFCSVGDNTIIRENVTVNRSMHEGGITRIGRDCFLLASSHVAHDATLEDSVTVVNYTAVTGHVYIERKAFISGYVALHQHVRIGEMAMIGGMARITKDIPPFMMAEGHPASIRGLNLVGLKRNGISKDEIRGLKEAYKILFLRKHSLEEAVERMELSEAFSCSGTIQKLVSFCKMKRNRPLERLIRGQRS